MKTNLIVFSEHLTCLRIHDSQVWPVAKHRKHEFCSCIGNTGYRGFEPLTDQEEVTKEEETTKNMFQKESGLQTGALDTTCSIGKWKGQTFREMLESPEGESAIRVIAMSQLPSAKTAKIVVDYHDGVAEE